MATIKISAMTEATAVADADLIPIVQGGANKSAAAGLVIQVKGKQGTITGNTAGDARGANATDLQLVRASVDQVAGCENSFIAGGQNNKIANIINRGTDNINSYAEGRGNAVYQHDGHAEGSGCVVDGKISHAEGNNTICSGNDSHTEGALSSCGRRKYIDVTSGSEDAGDGLGVLNYVIIPDSYGNQSQYFPNALQPDPAVTYGAGWSEDSKGNVYPPTFTPAVWDGDTLTTVNDLTWALHTICIIKGEEEGDHAFADIKKCAYTAESGTKVYYSGATLASAITEIHSSYCPTLLGMAQHAEGNYTNACGYGSHSEGHYSRAWGSYSHAESYKTLALGTGSHAEGRETQASGNYSHAEGQLTVASGLYAHVEGNGCTASGEGSHAEGGSSVANGTYAHAEGYNNQATGNYAYTSGSTNIASGNHSRLSGLQGIAKRTYQIGQGLGKRSVDGDNQINLISYTRSCSGAGWHQIHVCDELDDNRTYHFETFVIGRQTGGTAGTVGDSFAYKITGCIKRAGIVYTVLGTPTVTLIGKDEGMDGAIAITWTVAYLTDAGKSISLRFDSIADTVFQVTTNSIIQELG